MLPNADLRPSRCVTRHYIRFAPRQTGSAVTEWRQSEGKEAALSITSDCSKSLVAFGDEAQK